MTRFNSVKGERVLMNNVEVLEAKRGVSVTFIHAGKGTYVANPDGRIRCSKKARHKKVAI